MDTLYALIMAGGSGTRLWPLSRSQRPKPLINLIEAERSMFQVAVDRLRPLIPVERILVVANAELAPQLQKQAPDLPAGNFIIEPSARGTAAAVGLGAVHTRYQNPEAVMAVLTADHFIGNEDTFRHVLAAAYKVASTDGVVTLGIEPDHPSTGFGYIERGSLAHKVGETAVYELKQFHEKPDRAVAERYIQSGIYSWNSGMFIWQVGRVMEEFRLHSPDIHGILCRIEDTLGTPRYASVLEQEWPKIQRTTIDYALLEHIKSDIYVIPVEMGWQDIGNFSTLYDILAGSDGANISQCQQPVIQIDTRGTLIISKRLVAAVGVADLVIVDTDDALLVTTRAHAQEVKTIVEELKKRNLDSYL